MVCALSPKQEERLLKKISKDLLTAISAEEKKPFNLDEYINEIYNSVKKASNKEDLALTYAALVPRSLKILWAIDSEIEEYLDASLNDIKIRSKEFSDFDNVVKYFIGDPAGEAQSEAIVNKQIIINEAEEEQEAKLPTIAPIISFSELPNSFSTTVSDPSNPLYKFSYDFLKNQSLSGIVNSEVTGIYLTFGKINDLLPGEYVEQIEKKREFAHVLSDFDGNTLYFDKDFNISSREAGGEPVFFFLRTDAKQIQSKSELMKTHGFKNEEELNLFLDKQKKEINDKKDYVTGGPNRKIIQNIIGANHGYIPASKVKTNLSEVEDLSQFVIRIDQKEKGQKQFYSFDRGPFLMPIQFRTNDLSTDMDFVDKSADILLGNVLDESGKSSKAKLEVDRAIYFDVFFKNNSRLAFKDGILYVDKKPATSKEEVINAILYATVLDYKTKQPIQVKQVFKVHKTTLEDVPFYKIVDGQLRLFSKGLTGRQYRQFIQNHSYTLMEVNDQNKFVEFGGYYVFSEDNYRTVIGKNQKVIAVGETLTQAPVTSVKPTVQPIGEVKEGVAELFEYNPELASIGTPEQYSQYLDTIFPDSKVKDIVYRGAEKGIENHRAYSHWTLRKTLAENFVKQGVNLNKKDESQNTLYFALLNIKNLVRSIEITDKSLKEQGFDSAASFPNQQKPDGTYYDNEEANEAIQLIDKNLNNEITVFEPEQIHILGSKQDIEDFREFVKSPAAETPATETVGTSITYEQFNENLQTLLKDSLAALEKANAKSKKYILGFHGGSSFDKPDRSKQYTGEFRDPDIKRIAESMGARYEGYMLFFTEEEGDDLQTYEIAITSASSYALRYGNNNPTVYAYLIPIKEADFTDRGIGEVGLSYDAIEKGKYKEVGRTGFTVNTENITKTEEEDFNFVESKKIDLDDTLKQFDKLKGQKLINAGVTEEQLKAAKEWYEKSPLKEHVSLTELFNAVNSANPLSIATFNAMGITLYKGADYSDLYHEAWHAFTQMFLTKAERDSLYKEVRKRKGEFTDFEGKKLKYSDANDKQAEEVLAEEFREFMLSGGKKLKIETPVKKTIFQKIFDILKLLFNVNTEDILARDQSSTLINDMFEALRGGNIRSTPLGVDNSQFTNLDKIKALDDAQQKYADELGYEKAIKIVSFIDGLFSEFIDSVVNKGRNVNYTTAILSKPETRAIAYNYALSKIKEKVQELTNEIKELPVNSPDAINLREKRAILVFTIRNFANNSTNGEDIDSQTLIEITNINNTPTGKAAGIVAWHMEKSKYLSFEDKYELFEASPDVKSKADAKANKDESESSLTNNRDGYSHRAGNEVSMRELASNEVLYLIRSLFQYNKGEVSLDEFGFPMLGKFDENWNKILKLIGGLNDTQAMYNRMLSSTDPVIKQLVAKLGNPSLGTTGDTALTQGRLMQSNLWTKFYQVFSAKRIPLIQLTIDINSESGNVTIKPGRANAEIDKISRDWDSQFTNPNNPNKYIITKNKLSGKDRELFISNYLNVNAIVQDFEKTYLSDPVSFLRSIGIIVSDTPEIVKALKTNLKIFPQSIMKTLKTIKEKTDLAPGHKFYIRKPSELVKFKTEDSTSELTGYKELLTLESRFSEKYGTAMVSNAKGDAQYELSLRSTAANMFDFWNASSSYAELIANPAMRHLSMDHNTFIDKLHITRETFGDIKDPKATNKKIGETKIEGRYKGASLSLENSSGISVTIDEEFAAMGVASSETDDISQMLHQFYMMSLYGVSEASKHADKSTILYYKMNYAKRKNHFIEPYKFAKYDNVEDLETEKDFTDGTKEAVNSFVNYLAGEVERIYRLNNGDSSGTVTVGSKTYKDVGSNFVLFEDILKEDTQAKIMDKAIVSDFIEFINDPANADLLEDIQKDIRNYFNRQIDDFKQDAEKIGLFKNAALMSQVRKQMFDSPALASSLRKEENINFIDEAVIRNYVLNQLIHTTEFTLLFYGDVALYNHLKEEFHKRNAGFAATGNFMRLDEAMLQILNQSGANYSKSTWYNKEEYGEPETKNFGRTANTAVLEDVDSKSVSYDYYLESLIENEKQIRNVDELEPNVIKQITDSLKPYTKMTEGDGQGWVSFDFYRAMRMALGKWDWYQELLYNKILRNESVSTLEVIKFFPVEKMQYWGPLKVNGLMVMGFHKFSLMPLVPSVIKDSNLEILHNRMTQQNIDYALFQSGSKINTVTTDGIVDKFYVNPKRTENNAVAFASNDYRFTKNVIFLDYFKNQLETADSYKGSNIFPTQLRKLVEEGLMEQGVPTDFKPNLDIAVRKELWDALDDDSEEKNTENYKKLVEYEKFVRELTEYKIRELKKDLGVTDNEDVKISEALINFVKKELTRQDLSDHQIDFIRYNPVTGTLMYDLSIHPSAETIEKLLTALVYKRLIRQKVNGEPLVQVSGAGFEPSKLRKATVEERETYGNNFLPFYSKGKAMKVKIALQGDFKKLLKDKEVVKLAKETGDALKALNILIKQDRWLNEGDNRRMITIAGVRIPVQGFNSMEFAEVYEFLPEKAGNIIILPSEIVAKAGSDFDIDKLTILFPSIIKIKDQLTLVKHNRASENIASTVDLRARLQDLYGEKKAAYKSYEEFIKQYISSYPEELLDDYYKSVSYLNEAIKIFEDQMLSYSIMGEEIPLQLYDDLLEYYEAIDEITKEFSKPVREFKEKNLDSISNEIDKVRITIAEGSSKGIENNLLGSLIDIMSLERNFPELITPNSTDIMQPIAEDLADDVRDYDPFYSVTGKEFTYTKDGKKKKRIAGTRVIEIGYNRFKHVSNNIGKKTLGLGAVDNTYNTLFNRIGFYMNPIAYLKSGTIKQVLRMPHNKMKIENLDAISLSNLYTQPDSEGRVYKISNIISQMINGWVDVAKDSWIFDIQGNPELASTLLFLIQAGVEPKQAVYMISQPLVREYVKKQRSTKSSFAKPLGTSINEYQMFRNKARKDILSKYDPNMFNVKLRNVTGYILNNLVDKAFGEIPTTDSDVFNADVMRKRIKETASTYKDGTYIPSEDDYKRFIHFIEVEEMAKATTKIKLGINVDTARTTNLFQTREKLANIIDLYDQPRFSSSLIDALEKESPIGSFRVQEDMLKSIGSMFKIRDNEKFVKSLRAFTPDREDLLHLQYPGAFKNKEDFQNKYRNDFLNFVFQQWLYKPDRFSKYTSYKGLTINGNVKEFPIVSAGILAKGVFVDAKTGILNVDFSALKKQFNSKVFESESYWTVRKHSPVSSKHFDTGNVERDYTAFVKFIYERETLRYMIPYKSYKETVDFEFRKQQILISGQLAQEKSKYSIDDLAGIRAYEDFLRDTALINKLNLSFMFKDSSGYASQISAIDTQFPKLKEKYTVLNIFSYNTYSGISNISVNQKDMTSDDKSIYNAQLKELSDPNIQKVENKLDNDRISRFFSMLPIFNFVQSGQDTKSSLSLSSIVDTTLYERLMSKATNETANIFSADFLQSYNQAFNRNYTTRDEGGELLSYRRKGYKDYFTNFLEEDKKKTFVNSAEYDPNVKVFNAGLIDPKTFKDNVISSAKNNSKNLFIYDDSLETYIPKKNIVPGSVYISTGKKPQATFNTTVIKDFAGKDEMDPKQAIGIIVKKSAAIIDADGFLTDETLSKNKEAIDSRIRLILDKVADGYTPIFSEEGVGNALLGYGRKETVDSPNSQILKTPPALETYLYLSKELYRNFGYINPLAKQYEQITTLLTEKQTVTDDDVREQLYECFFKS